MCAVRSGSLEITKMLLESGADVKLISSDDSKGVLVACENNHFDIVKLLVSAGAAVNHKSEVMLYFVVIVS